MARRSVRLTSAAVLIVAVLALAGCGRPAGVDGSLTNNWPAMPEPSLPAVTAPACYLLSMLADPTTVRQWPAPVACTASHNSETFFVGQFTGAAAQTPAPPRLGGEATIAAYAECTRAAREYLGDDWRAALLEVALLLPTHGHWELGARWYRCDVVQYSKAQTSALEVRTTSAKGILAGPSDVRLGCFHHTAGIEALGGLNPVACTEPHNVEFVGVPDLPAGPYLEGDAREPSAEKACHTAIAAYVGLPNDNDMQYRTGWVSGVFSPEQWSLGNRGMRCYLWTDTKVLTTSMKGAGTKAFPVR